MPSGSTREGKEQMSKKSILQELWHKITDVMFTCPAMMATLKMKESECQSTARCIAINTERPIPWLRWTILLELLARRTRLVPVWADGMQACGMEEKVLEGEAQGREELRIPIAACQVRYS